MRRESSIEPGLLERALELAERGRFGVSPNPLVGAVVARGKRVVGEGFHRRAGGSHAEVKALRDAGGSARGADLYVTLEPCAHFGRTPPCTEAIRAAGIRRVIVAADDPHPLVSGRGIRALKRAGIPVLRSGARLRDLARAQNDKFVTWVSEGRPLVLAKWAASLDGRTADSMRGSRWITGAAARRRGLLLREEYDAVLVGAGTILADDPLLTRRLGRNRSSRHWRIVLDGRLRIPENARILRQPEGVVVATAMPSDDPRARRLSRRGITVWSLPGRRPGRCRLEALLSKLAREDVTSLMIEGGAETLWEFFRARLVDRVAVFVAPRILGGEAAPGGVGGAGFPLSRTPWMEHLRWEAIGADLLIEGRVSRARARRPPSPG